jgi:PhnB protein
MQLNAYLLFEGQCEAAFKFYERILNGKIRTLLTYGNTPMGEKAPPESRDKVAHVTLDLGDKILMGSDAPSSMSSKPQGFAVHLALPTVSDAERVFKALSENATIQMPMQKTFWSPGFGQLTDQFGTPWMVNTEEPLPQ